MLTQIQSFIAGHEVIVGLMIALMAYIALTVVAKTVKRWWDNQEILVGFLDTGDDGRLPLRSTRGDNRLRLNGGLVTAPVYQVSLERGLPVYHQKA